MSKGDLCFLSFKYWKEIVGIVEVIKEAFIDQLMSKFVAVKVSFKKYLERPVSLEMIKKISILKIWLVKQSRLSDMPIDTKAGKY